MSKRHRRAIIVSKAYNFGGIIGAGLPKAYLSKRIRRVIDECRRDGYLSFSIPCDTLERIYEGEGE